MFLKMEGILERKSSSKYLTLPSSNSVLEEVGFPGHVYYVSNYY